MSTVLQHSPADILRYALIALGVGTDPADAGSWPIYVAGEPSTPDEVVTLYDTSPKNDGRSMIDGERQEHHGCQVRIRARDHVTGYAKAKAIQHTLDEGVYEELVHIDNVDYLVHCASKTNLLTLGKETPTSKRCLFTVNCLLAITALG